jgi:monomeric sarcosine oxidase
MGLGDPECIVLGLGGVGSAALSSLARRGVRALGIERFAPGHDRGSSHGDSRIIRLAYSEHPDYVPLLRRAYELWAGLEERSGQKLFHRTGLLQVGPPGGEVIRGTLESARIHGLAVEHLDAAEAMRRFPGFRVDPAHEAVFEEEAGYLRVEDCVRAHAGEAARLGAVLRTGEEVRSFRKDGAGFAVETSRGTHRAGALVIAPGAWGPGLLQDLRFPLEVRRKPVFWFRSGSPLHRESGGCPAYLFETDDGKFYGIPENERMGLKAAEHTGGEPVPDPLRVERSERPADRRRIEAFLERCLPSARRELSHHSVCLYTLTPDEHSIAGKHPALDRCAIATGLSGHGFKLTPVLGEALADIVSDGRTKLPIEFLSPERAALSPPG